MLKSWKSGGAICAALAISSLGTPASAQDVLGPDAAACRPGADGPAALVRIHGFKDRVGNLRLQLYGDKADEFLEKGKKLKRIEMAVPPGGDMQVCVALPRAGQFAIVALHDRNANRKMNPTSDGVGFSRNPRLGLSKPDYAKVAFTANGGIQTMDIVMNYMKGLSVRPVVALRS